MWWRKLARRQTDDGDMGTYGQTWCWKDIWGRIEIWNPFYVSWVGCPTTHFPDSIFYYKHVPGLEDHTQTEVEVEAEEEDGQK